MTGYTDLIAGYISGLSPLPTGMKPSGQLIKPIKAVMFDVYGTMLISGSGDISTAMKQVHTAERLENLVRAYRYPGSADSLLEAFFSEIRRTHESMRMQGADWPEVEIDRVWMRVLGASDRETARRFAVEFEMIVNPCYPMPYLDKVLARLAEEGVKTGIISNAQFFTPFLFKALFGDWPENLGFQKDLIFYSYQHGAAKPSCRLFRIAAERLKAAGIRAGESLYAGNDMLNDIMPASGEGFQTALFAGDKRSLRLREDDPRCSHVRPDLVLTDWRQILEHVI